MSEQTFKVKIIVEGQDKNASSVFKKTNESVSDFEKAAKKAVTGLTAMAVAQGAIRFAKLGADVQVVTQRFERFAGGSARAAEMLAAFQAGADGTADKMTAMAGATKLLQLGVVETSDELETMTSLAVKLGDQTLSVSGRIADFGSLLANTSTPRLDNFGISSGKVRARIIELQASIAGLSREEAFKIAVMEEGTKSLAVLGDTSDTVNVKIETLTAAFTDMRDGLAVIVADRAIATIDGDFGGLTRTIRRFPVAIEGMLAGFDALFEGRRIGETVVEELDNALRAMSVTILSQIALTENAAEASRTWQKDEDELRRVLEETTAATASAVEPMTELAQETVKVGLGLGGIAAATPPAIGPTEDLTKALVAEAEAAAAASQTQIALAESLLGATNAKIAAVAINELGKAVSDDVIGTEAYVKAVTQVQLAFGLADEKSLALRTGILELTAGIADGEIELHDFGVELDRVIEEAGKTRVEIAGIDEAIAAIPTSTTIDIILNVQRIGAELPAGVSLDMPRRAGPDVAGVGAITSGVGIDVGVGSTGPTLGGGTTTNTRQTNIDNSVGTMNINDGTAARILREQRMREERLAIERGSM